MLLLFCSFVIFYNIDYWVSDYIKKYDFKNKIYVIDYNFYKTYKQYMK